MPRKSMLRNKKIEQFAGQTETVFTKDFQDAWEIHLFKPLCIK
jgi:hypothetical protein